MNKDWSAEVQNLFLTYAVPLAGKVIGAIVLWIVGRIVLSGVRGVLRRNLERRKLDATLVGYVDSVVGVLLTIVLLLAVLSVFGVETTSFAGLLAAGGVAIGLAWSGLLSNFAAGVFMIVLRPFKVGDFVTAGGVTGTVHEVGLFVTAIDTPDNVRTYVGNSKVFGDTIQNFTQNKFRRVELTAQVAHSVDPNQAMEKLRERIAKIPHVLADPAPSLEILEFSAFGPVLAVRPFCHNDHYWDVYFATNAAIQEVFSKAGYAVPEQRRAIRQIA